MTDGIHTYNGANLDNIYWMYVGKDAMTIKSSGTTTVSNIEGYDADDKFFQINAALTLTVTNSRLHGRGDGRLAGSDGPPGHSAVNKEGMIDFKDRNVVSSIVIAAAIASAAILISKHRQTEEPAAVAESASAQASQSRQRPLVSPLVPEQSRALAATDDTFDPALLAQVEHKYRFLISEVDEEHVDELRRRLLERESEIDLRSRDRIDAGIGKMLPAESFAYYQTLKDSDETTQFSRELGRLQQRINAK